VSLDLNTILGGSSGLAGAKTWSLTAGQAIPWWIGVTSAGTLRVQAPASELSSTLPLGVQVTDAGGIRKTGTVSIKVLKPTVDTILPIVIGGSAALVQDLRALVPSAASASNGDWAFAGPAPAWMTLTASGTLNAQLPAALISG
jgi:hypothetical protein